MNWARSRRRQERRSCGKIGVSVAFVFGRVALANFYYIHCFVYVQLSPDKHAGLKRLFLFISLVKTTLICVILLHVDFNLFLTNSRSYNSFAFTLPS
jgi:hypothetical protein